jgi:hypothetical protein
MSSSRRLVEMATGNSTSSPGSIASLISTSVEAGQSAIVSGNGVDVSFGTRVIAVEGDRLTLVNTVPFAMISKFVKSSRFSIQVDLLRIHADQVESDGKNLVFKAAAVDSISETRSDERFSFSRDEHVTCEFLNPEDNETVLVKPVLDMSASGFSLRTSPGSQLFTPGRKLAGIRILIGDRPYSTRDAETVYQRKYMDENGTLHQQVGLKFTTAGGNEKTQQT